MAAFFNKASPLLLLVLFVGLSSCRLTVLPSPQSPTPLSSYGLETYIVFTVDPPANEDKKHFYLRILSKAIGGDLVANFALLYTYTEVTTGFAARLTLDQVSALDKQPEVVGIIKSELIHLDPPAK